MLILVWDLYVSEVVGEFGFVGRMGVMLMYMIINSFSFLEEGVVVNLG